MTTQSGNSYNQSYTLSSAGTYNVCIKGRNTPGSNDPGTQLAVSQIVTVTAVLPSTVTFNSNGGTSVSSQTVNYNSTATQPTVPTKTGYSFAGWYSNSGLTSIYNFSTPVTANITLYAKWTINTYTVTFNSNGGTSVSSQTVNYNSTATQPTAPTKAGYSFAGWYSNSGLTSIYNFSTPVTANITLYVKWWPIPVAPSNLTASISYGNMVTLSWTAPPGNTSIIGYDIYCDGNNIGYIDSTTTSYNDDEAPINSTLSYYIKAIDSYGGESVASASVLVTTEEYGNNKEEAALLEYDNCIFSGQINYVGDIDFFKFIPSYNTTYTIRSTGNMDAFGHLYDSTGNLLSSCDDARGLGTNFQITYYLTAGQTYYFSVRHWNLNLTGEYGVMLASSYMALPNTAPSLSIQNLSANQVFDENSSSIAPQICVTDDGDSLTCKLFVDNENQPRSIKTGYSGQTITFDPINAGQLVNGMHQIRFEVSDGYNWPATQTVNIKVDRLPPEGGNISVTNDIGSVTVQIAQTPSDSMSGMSDVPYRYTIGSAAGEWTTSASHTFLGLSAATEYNIKVEVRDNTGHIKTFEQLVNTIAQASTITVSNTTVSSFEINVTDTNPSNTQYQIMVGTKYVSANGRLSNMQKWVTLTGKKIKVIGVSPGTAYIITVKSRNTDDIITTEATGNVTTPN